MSGNRRKPFIARVTTGWKDGKQLYETIGYFKTRKEATIALAEYNSNPYDVDIKKLTFTDIYTRWSERKFPELSPKRVSQYESIYRKLEDFHKLTFSDIKTAGIQKFFDSRVDITSSTLTHYKALFNQLYKYAIKHEIVQKNYAELVEIRKTKKAKTRKIFSTEEIQLLWEHSDDKDVQLILILIYTGMRITELLTMKQENVFLNERYMIGGIKTEAGIDRVIPINKKIHPFIEELCKTESTYLLKKQNNGRTENYSYHGFRHSTWKPIMQKLNLTHSIHDTRHTTVSLMDASGVNRTALKRIIGHKNADMTEHYTHKTIQELIQEMDKI